MVGNWHVKEKLVVIAARSLKAGPRLIIIMAWPLASVFLLLSIFTNKVSPPHYIHIPPPPINPTIILTVTVPVSLTFTYSLPLQEKVGHKAIFEPTTHVSQKKHKVLVTGMLQAYMQHAQCSVATVQGVQLQS